ncbi:MAG: hypothetical protein LUE10_04975 [Alistipes sp.]|nr:hypothetical protein [Alistipes sp.]
MTDIQLYKQVAEAKWMETMLRSGITKNLPDGLEHLIPGSIIPVVDTIDKVYCSCGFIVDAKIEINVIDPGNGNSLESGEETAIESVFSNIDIQIPQNGAGGLHRAGPMPFLHSAQRVEEAMAKCEALYESEKTHRMYEVISPPYGVKEGDLNAAIGFESNRDTWEKTTLSNITFQSTFDSHSTSNDSIVTVINSKRIIGCLSDSVSSVRPAYDWNVGFPNHIYQSLPAIAENGRQENYPGITAVTALYDQMESTAVSSEAPVYAALETMAANPIATALSEETASEDSIINTLVSAGEDQEQIKYSTAITDPFSLPVVQQTTPVNIQFDNLIGNVTYQGGFAQERDTFENDIENAILRVLKMAYNAQ